MANIILINPKADVPLLDWAMRYPPLGLMYIAGALEGHQVEILDLKVENIKKKVFLRKIGAADIIGITVLTPSIDVVSKYCRIAKELGVLTVLGGVHPSLIPEIVENPEVDIVVRGEGELTFKDIANGKALDTIQGISYMKDGQVIHNPDRPPADLNTLPPPRRDLVAKNSGKYKAWSQRLDAITTARGCPYNCSFCCVPRVWKGYREQSPKEVIKELKRMDPKAEIIAIVDDNFCHNMKRVKEICELIIKEGLNKQYKYSVFSRIDSVVKHPEVVEFMAKAKMNVVFIGIEAASQLSLDKMHKGTKLEDIEKACDILEKNGIMIWGGHIIGNLNDKWEDVDALINLTKKLPIDIAQFTVITPYPGTELYDLAMKQNLIDVHDFTEYCECEPPMHTPHLSRLELLELEMRAYLKFYGFWTMIKRARRWSKNPKKKWLSKQSLSSYRSFMKFRTKTALYFFKAYKGLVMEKEGVKDKFSQKIPLLSTPKTYALSTAIIAALITFLITSITPYYGVYSSLSLDKIIGDLLVSSVIVASTNTFVSTWLAFIMYRHGWVLSLRQRSSEENFWKPLGKSIKYGITYSILMVLIMGLSIGFLFLVGFTSITYQIKEILVSLIAFLTVFFVSYKSIHGARNTAKKSKSTLKEKEEKIVEKRFCGNCGKNISPEENFCPFCGVKKERSN